MKKIFYKIKFDQLLKISCYLIFILLSFYLVNKTFQNDTFYTIKIGDLIRKQGIDFLDHFCMIKNLKYTYPHFLYDVLISFLYSKFNFLGIYISTIIFTFFISISLFKTNQKVSNKYIGFIITLIELFLLRGYLTARAQVVTFSLFILTYYFIVKYLEKPKKIYAIILIIIPILIANTHVAVFPFYFVLYLPFLAEYLIAIFLKKRNKKLEYFKLIVDNNQNVKKLFIIFIISLFTGFLTPLKLIPYTYLINTFRGNSMSMISEHLPLVLYKDKEYLIYLGFMILILIFSKTKLVLRDFFFFIGMTLLSIMQNRQVSMAIIFNGFLMCKLIYMIFKDNNLSKHKIFKFFNYIYLIIVYIGCLLLIIFLPKQLNIIKSKSYVDSSWYPVRLVNYIKENIDYKNTKFYNEYDYGSYLLFNDIPVFVDSRADLYTKEFNNFSGSDILTDSNKAFNCLDNIIDKYKFDYLILLKDSQLDVLVRKGYQFEKEYEDIYFVLWKVR
ncbi:MAG: hypothetical protein IKN63_02430 [Bacilli bacterium]|nr:hypothetical protein [Bacilli bacterium]